MKNQQIYLTGFMGTGKSTVAACFHKVYGMEQIEMDGEIEKGEGKSIPDIFKENGEAYFRSLETALLERLSGKENAVVSCGGGTVMRSCNVELMKKRGRIVLLTASPETVYERVRRTHNRPLLEGNMNVEYIRGLMEGRRAKYEAAADFVIQTDGKRAEELCREIMERLQEAGSRRAVENKEEL